MDLVQDCLDPLERFVGIGMDVTEIVGADQDDRDPWEDGIQLAMLKTPKQMAGAVAFEAEIDGMTIAVEVLPCRSKVSPVIAARSLPILGDGVAEP